MKKYALKIIFMISLLVLGMAVCASAEFVFIEDYQSYPVGGNFGSSDWTIKKVDDTVDAAFAVDEMNGNKYLSSTSNANYVQSLPTVDMTLGSTVVSLNLNIDETGARCTGHLRGRLSASSNDNVKLFEASNGTLKVLKSSEEIAIDGWKKLSFVFDKNDTLKAYVDGTLKYTIDDYTAVYPNFVSHEGTAALRLSVQNGAFIDDVALYNNISLNDNYIISSPVYKITTESTATFDASTYDINGIKKGDMTAYIAYTKLTDEAAQTICACYNDDSLKDISFSDFSEDKCTDILQISMPTKELLTGNSIKLFNLLKGDAPTPLSKFVIAEIPSYIRQFPSELELKFNKTDIHPRLMADDTFFNDLKMRYLSGDTWCRELVSDADIILTKSQPTCSLGATNILGTSREVLQRITTLSIAYNITGDTKYLAYAETMLNTVCGTSFGNWCRETHFFSCAEMSAAVSIGYDWLYNDLQESTISLIEEKIYENSLEYAHHEYKKRITGSTFFTGSGNKNLVYNGAMVVTALSFADIYPQECFSIISESFECIPEALASFSPDGAWNEGTDYWRYGVNYLSMMMASFESVYDTDFAISSFDGLDNAMNFIAYMKGPCGYNNFHDSEGGSDTPAIFYLAKIYNSPDIAATRINMLSKDISKLEPLDLIYFDNSLHSGGNESNLPLNAFFGGVEAMSMRSSWTGDDSLYVSAHGGKNKGSHVHVDAGTFVFDYLGERWICDLGRESLSYVSNDTDLTNTYYRVSAHGHNVFVINPKSEAVGQDIDANVTVSDYDFEVENSYVTYNMQSAYKTYARSATRQFKLNNHKSILTIIDNIKLYSEQSGKTIEWYFHTDADAVLVDDNNIMLTKGDKSIYFNVKPSSTDISFTLSVEDAPSHSGQESNSGIKCIKISAVASPDIMLTMKFSENKIS